MLALARPMWTTRYIPNLAFGAHGRLVQLAFNLR